MVKQVARSSSSPTPANSVRSPQPSSAASEIHLLITSSLAADEAIAPEKLGVKTLRV